MPELLPGAVCVVLAHVKPLGAPMSALDSLGIFPFLPFFSFFPFLPAGAKEGKAGLAAGGGAARNREPCMSGLVTSGAGKPSGIIMRTKVSRSEVTAPRVIKGEGGGGVGGITFVISGRMCTPFW